MGEVPELLTFEHFCLEEQTAIPDLLLHRNEILTIDETQDGIRMKYRKGLFHKQGVES
jgi:hypothetical protein